MTQPSEEDERRTTPEALREGVRSALHSALVQDLDRRGGRTGANLAASGAIGVAGALAITWLVAGHPLDHHPTWHLATFSTAWAGLLIVALALAFLDVRTPRWPIGSAARAAVLALVLAGCCAWICPDQHFLDWWATTQSGRTITRLTGTSIASVACFGIVTATAFALLAGLLMLPRNPVGRRHAVFATAAAIIVLQMPGIVLQSAGEPVGVLAGWLSGAAVGSLAGVAGAAAFVTRAPVDANPAPEKDRT